MSDSQKASPTFGDKRGTAEDNVSSSNLAIYSKEGQANIEQRFADI